MELGTRNGKIRKLFLRWYSSGLVNLSDWTRTKGDKHGISGLSDLLDGGTISWMGEDQGTEKSMCSFWEERRE